MPNLDRHLELSRCPFCRIDHPHLVHVWQYATTLGGSGSRTWATYTCQRCGGVITAWAHQAGGPVVEHYPTSESVVSEDIPERARAYLEQAIDSRHAPAGAVMLAASAVDAMLKAKDLRDGSLHDRIQSAAEQHLITEEMAAWAHDVRLDANDQRHADDNDELPTTDDAKRGVSFALALAEFLFVLPRRYGEVGNNRPASPYA